MRYRRALLVVEPDDDVGAATAVLRRLVPALDAQLVRRAETLDGDGLAALVAAEGIDLLVFASRSLRSASLVSLLRPSTAVLWTGSGATTGPLLRIGCVALDDRSRAAITAFLRAHADPSVPVALLSPFAIPPEVVDAGRAVVGVEADVEVSSPTDAGSLLVWLESWRREGELDLLVFSRLETALLLGALWTVPILLVPPLPSRPFGTRALDAADVLDTGGPLRLRVDQAVAVGDLPPADDEDLLVVAGGRVVGSIATDAGQAELPRGLAASPLGLARIAAGAPLRAVAAVEASLSVIRPGPGPVVLVDAELPEASLRALARADAAAQLLAVRLRPSRSCRALRDRLHASGLAPVVLDARALLDEGEALDVSELLDPVRLARTGERLRREGIDVVAIVHRGPLDPTAVGLVAVDPTGLEVALDAGTFPPPVPRNAASGGASPLVEGNRIELEADNRTARRWLLEAMGGCASTLHVQSYMATDDDVGAAIEAALLAAAGRGVRVRVLVDSLHGLHGSFGARNPLLDRLERVPGVEVRTARPITELPSIVDLKLRDHRKLVVADGRLALLGGRNLAHEYYTAPDEVVITEASPWRVLPWLDAGARVEGPLVATLAASFRDAWVDAGGEAFAVTTPRPAGRSAGRVVVHRGLREARTLEAYRDLIDGASSHLLLVTGYPLLLELQHALLRALRRGVRVRTLVGYVVPSHAGGRFGGSWMAPRRLATELVHSRMDPLVAAGAEVHHHTLRDVPGWSPTLGAVQANVHAKILCADGRRCAVGSANPDVTASYWESELLLVAEDPAVVAPFEARLAASMATSTPVDREDPTWQLLARRRAWMRHWPGLLSA